MLKSFQPARKLGENQMLEGTDLTGTAIQEVPSSISFLICRGCEKEIFKSTLDSVHHEFENSAVVKATKIMGTYDDSNVAEHCASWSFPGETERGNNYLTHPFGYNYYYLILLYFLRSCNISYCLSSILCRLGLFSCCIGIYWVDFVLKEFSHDPLENRKAYLVFVTFPCELPLREVLMV